MSETDDKFWGVIAESEVVDDYKDPIERAAEDSRLTLATRFMLLGETTSIQDIGQYNILLEHVSGDYQLGPGEMLVAIGINEDRFLSNSSNENGGASNDG